MRIEVKDLPPKLQEQVWRKGGKGFPLSLLVLFDDLPPDLFLEFRRQVLDLDSHPQAYQDMGINLLY